MRTPADLADLPELTADERSRYGRHLILPEVGLDGQRRLKGARVLLVGAGGLGSPAALYLAAAGVGHLTIVDPDVVDASNLQRQVLHGTAALGRPKVDSGASGWPTSTRTSGSRGCGRASTARTPSSSPWPTT